MYKVIHIVVFSLAALSARSQVIWEPPAELHPVHGLYVKPSSDGTTGDLYVAATEENGIKSQWLTDQPINFLPAATNLQPKTVPLTSSPTKTSPRGDKITNQKRAIITSPAVKYAYTLPGAENLVPYPYAAPTNPPSEGSVTPPCSKDIPAQPYPFQYFYPQMMSAITNVMKSYKESESTEENTPIAAPTPYWPQAYGYPYQYVFIDPNTWAQSQTNPLPSEAPSSGSSETA
ncbi:uncharacterized protein LOC120624393 [Pararge aegeria]|uniref:Jg3296 protein n=2 Tax=Pararge aegeria TaxID=116150 RepID=A0A8S4RTU6_9NEOP|nr:uncharacterized protein LOC120624393 [Pararge aegeria]CAH2241232.1 jg3296 [Pararge aegeria aegeria]